MTTGGGASNEQCARRAVSKEMGIAFATFVTGPAQRCLTAVKLRLLFQISLKVRNVSSPGRATPQHSAVPVPQS